MKKLAELHSFGILLNKKKIGNGLPQGVGKILTMRIKIFDNKGIEINAFGFALKPDDISNSTKNKKKCIRSMPIIIILRIKLESYFYVVIIRRELRNKFGMTYE